MYRNSPKNIYIPLCGKDRCSIWLKKLGKNLEEKQVHCQTEHPINGKYTKWFKEYFQDYEYTIMHHCPFLWKKVYSCNKLFESQDEKLILLRIVPEEERTNYDSIDSSLVNSLDNFFQEMDSEQRVCNDTDLHMFIDKVMTATAPRRKESPLENIDQFEGSVSSDLSCSPSIETMTCSPSIETMTDDENLFQQNRPVNSEDSSDCPENFSKYYDIFGSMENMSLYVRTCDIQWTLPKDFKYDATHKLVSQINALKKDDLQDMNYVLHKLLPMLCLEKRFVEISSVAMCKWNLLKKRALVLLEFILWEDLSYPFSEDKSLDINVLTNINAHLSLIMQKLSKDDLDIQKDDYVKLRKDVTHVMLLVLSHMILISEKNRETSVKAEACLTSKSHDLTDSDDENETLLRMFLADGIRCTQVNDCAQRYLQEKPYSNTIESNFIPKTLIQENLCVQMVVIYGLLKKVFCLDKNALVFLEEYAKYSEVSKTMWKREISAPMPCISMIFHGLKMFLALSIRKKGEMDVKDISSKAMSVFSLAAYRHKPDEVDEGLHLLIFDSRDLIRQGSLSILSKSKREVGQEILLHYSTTAIEQMLTPFLRKIKALSLENDTRRSYSQEWKSYAAFYAYMPVQILVHTYKEENGKHDKNKEQRSLGFKEILNLKKLKHDNIITMFAYQIDKMPQFYILEDSHQRLQAILKNAHDNQKLLEPKLLSKLLVDVLKGLIFCHTQGYIHRDLTAHSICVVNLDTAKLCDFGLCQRLASSEIVVELNSLTIPLRWSAPESIFKGEFSKASDIWMVGHLIYEVMTHGLLPYSTYFSEDEKFVDILQARSASLQREQCLDDKCFELIIKCTDYNSLSRPSIEEVFMNFEEIFNNTPMSLSAGKNYPILDGTKRKPSVLLTRGIPKGHCLKNIVRTKSHTKRIKQMIYLTSGIRQINMTDGRAIIEEKLFHSMSEEAMASIVSKDLQDIFPPFELQKSSLEALHVKCEIDSSSRSLSNFIQKKALGPDILLYLKLLLEVAETLCKLHKRLWIIGDLSPSCVFVDGKTLKISIVSLSFLKFMGSNDASSFENNVEVKIPPNRLSSAAPEVLSNGLFTYASDVFCFGNFAWVLLTAFDESKDAISQTQDEIRPFGYLSKEEQFQALVSGKWNEYNKQPLCCPDALYRLILQCVSIKEKDRPTMQQICQHLAKINTTDDYPLQSY